MRAKETLGADLRTLGAPYKMNLDALNAACRDPAHMDCLNRVMLRMPEDKQFVADFARTIFDDKLRRSIMFQRPAG